MSSSQDFYMALRERESSNNYQAENQFGFLGAYQMGEMALDDAGFYDSNDGTRGENDWSGGWSYLANEYGISSKDDFLNNTAVQDYAIRQYHEKVWGYLKSWGFDSLVGQTINGIEITKSGLIAAYHLIGGKGLKEYFNPSFDPTSDDIPTDANGTSLEDYLRQFGGYDLDDIEEKDLDLDEIYQGFGDEATPCSTPCCADAMDLARNYLMEGMAIPSNGSPIVLDLDGDGVETIGLADSNAFFDMDMDGFRENVQWLSGDDGLLALDSNSNGVIDDRTELFGDTEGFANGWDKLATLDSNSDGVIDANDAAWSDLLVWRDLDGDGHTDEGELFTLDDLGVTSINLDYDDTLTSSFTLADGAIHEVTDLYFEQDQMLTVYGGEVDLDPEVLFLPWLRGYGEVADLPIAMSLDAELKAMVVDMVHIEDAGELYAAVEDLLAKWAGVDDVDPEAMRGAFNARNLGVLEHFMGVDYVQANTLGSPNVFILSLPYVEKAYSLLLNHAFNIFGFQSLLEGNIEWASYDILQDVIIFDDDSEDLVSAIINDIAELNDGQLKVLGGIIDSGYTINSINLLDVYGLVSPDAMDSLLFYVGSSNVVSHGDGDLLYGNDVGHVLWGMGGDDTLVGFDSHETLVGGTGDDSLVGGAQGDTYFFARGDGHDILYDHDTITDVIDTLNFVGDVTPEDVEVLRDEYDLILRIKDSGDDIRIKSHFGSSYYQVERIVFTDGNEWTPEDIKMMDMNIVSTQDDDNIYGGADTADIMFGLDGDDSLSGSDLEDTLFGGPGNDYLSGGHDGDTYVFGRGDGYDVISDYDISADTVDRVLFTDDISPDDMEVFRDGYDLILRISGSDDGVSVWNYFNGSGYRIEKFIFPDGTEWGHGDIQAMEFMVAGTEGNDNLTGWGDSTDILCGFAGDDTLSGFDLADTLDGGTGDDSLAGGLGGDTYLFGRGDGSDVIKEYDTAADAVDVVRLADDVLPEDLDVLRDGYDLILRITDTGDEIRVTNQFKYPSYQVEKFIFSNGIEWDAEDLLAMDFTVMGTDGEDNLVGWSDSNYILCGLAGDDTLNGWGLEDTLDGGAGDDSLAGGYGGDTYVFGRGSGVDTVYENDYTSGNMDAVHFTDDVSPDDVEIIREDNGLCLKIIDSGDEFWAQNHFSGYRYGMEKAVFADGTEWDLSDYDAMPVTVHGTSGNDNISGGGNTTDVMLGHDGDDTLLGDALSDTLDGGAGDDSLAGGYDGDTYVFGRGSGVDTVYENDYTSGNVDVVHFTDDVSPDDVEIIREDNGLCLKIIDSGDELWVPNHFSGYRYGMEKAVFADGTEWDLSDYDSMPVTVGGASGNDILVGYDNTIDVVVGYDGDDVLSGKALDDILIGGAGNDSLDGGSGADIYHYTSPSEGGDTITDWDDGSDTFRFDSTAFDSMAHVVSMDSSGIGYDGTNAATGASDAVFVYDTNGDDAGGEEMIAQITDGAVDIDDADITFA